MSFNNEKENDLTDFLKNREVLLISDFEGTAPKAHFQNFQKYCTSPEKGVVFLGDAFDSTVLLGDKNCESAKCTDADLDHNCLVSENYCALKTIKLLVDNPDKCRYVVGNRDLNKIKLLPFFQLKSGDNWWLNGSTYAEIVDNLLQLCQSTNDDIWLIDNQNADAFKPFWNLKKWNENQTKRNELNLNYNDLFTRFEYLFGEDGMLGSMSAMITLKSIPNELLGLINKTTIDSFMEKLPNLIVDQDPLKITKTRLKVRAALVMTVFMRMLAVPFNSNNLSLNTPGALDGYLHQYLSKAKPAYYAVSLIKEKRCLFLFAHGGITPEFVLAEGSGAKKLMTDVNWESLLNPGKNTIGGGGLSGEDIKTSIDNFNQFYFKVLKDYFFNLMYSNKITGKDNWKKYFFTLLQLTAGTQSTIDKMVIDQGYRADYSPIQIKKSLSGKPHEINDEPGQKNLDVPDYDRIYNVFGHASASCGYTFGKVTTSYLYENKVEELALKTFYINTDFSSTLFKDSLECDDSYNTNFLALVLDVSKSNLSLSGKVSLKKAYVKITEPTNGLGFDNKAISQVMKTDFENSKTTQFRYYVDQLSEAINGCNYEMDEKINIFEEEIYYDITPNGVKVAPWGFNGVAKNVNQLDGKFYVYSSDFSKNGYCVAFLLRKPELEVGGFFSPRKSRKNKKSKSKKSKKNKSRKIKRKSTRRLRKRT
jgi:hypothetical protein